MGVKKKKKKTVQGVGGGRRGGGIGGPPIKKWGKKKKSFSFISSSFGCKDNLSMCTGVGGGYGTVDRWVLR